MNLSTVPAIDLIIGPMFCGKSSEVLRRLLIYYEMDLKVLYVNAKLDTRAVTDFSTHNKMIGTVPFETIKVSDLSEVKVENYNVIAVDEAQFFTSLVSTVLDWVENQGKIVIVSGLNGDSNRKKFGEILDLLVVCDSVTKLAPFCRVCRQKKGIITAGLFSKRLCTEDSTILVGGEDKYIPVCRACYCPEKSTVCL